MQRIVVNEVVAQASLAIVLKKPSDARRRKYKVLVEMYDRIFSGQVVEPYIIVILLERVAKDWVLKSGYTNTQDEMPRKLANNGLFHLARAAAYIWRGSDNWSMSAEQLRDQINILEANSATLANVFVKAFETIAGVIKGNAQHQADIDTALKSATLENELNLDRALHS